MTDQQPRGPSGGGDLLGKRQAIVQAGIELIQESGLAGLTQPRVAQRLGLRQSHLTYYYPTRDDMLIAVAEEAVRQRADALQAIVEGDRTQRLPALARLLTAPEPTRVLVALAQAADRNDAVRASFRPFADAVTRLSTSLLEEAGVPVDPTVLALVRSAATGIAVLSLASGGENLAPLAEGVLTDLFRRLGVSV